MLVRVDDIKIAEKITLPKRNRIEVKKSFYNEHGRFAMPIEITKDNVLTDGYAAYIAAKEMGLDQVECEYMTIKSITNCEWPQKAANRKFTACQRKIIYDKNHGLCAICGKPVAYNNFTIDHWKPLAEGGTNELDNLKVAHKACNEMKGSFQPEVFINEINAILTFQASRNEALAKAMIHTSIKLVIPMAMRKVKSFIF